MSRESIVKGVLLLLCAGATYAGVYLMVEPQEAVGLARRLNYWVCAAIAGAILYFLFQAARGVDVRGLALRHRWGLALVVACALFLQVHEPHRFKVLFDEHALAGTAYQMHYQRLAEIPARAHFVNGRLEVVNTFVDKRRPFYSFVLSVAHDLTGYRASNSWRVNGVLGAVLLLLAYAWGASVGTRRHGVLAVLLLTGLPLLAQNATGGGLDLLNLVLIAGLLHAMRRYLQRPGVAGLDLCIALCLGLATTRYESVLYLGALACVVVYKWITERRVSLTWFSAVSPVLLTATLLCDHLWPSNDVYFYRAEGVSMFGLDHLAPNLGIAAYYLLAPPWDDLNNSLPLTLDGIVSLLLFTLLLVRKIRELRNWPPALLAFVPVLLVGLGITLLTQFYFWGQLTDPLATRFILTAYLLSALLLPTLLGWEFPGLRLPAWVPGVAAAWVLLVTASQNGRHFQTHDMATSVTQEWFDEWAQDKGPRTLLLNTSVIGCILNGHPSVSLAFLKGRLPQLRMALEAGYYDDAYILEERTVDPATGGFHPEQGDVAPPELVLERERELWIRPHVVAIISRVVGLRAEDGTVSRFERMPLPPLESDAAVVDYYLKALP